MACVAFISAPCLGDCRRVIGIKIVRCRQQASQTVIAFHQRKIFPLAIFLPLHGSIQCAAFWPGVFMLPLPWCRIKTVLPATNGRPRKIRPMKWLDIVNAWTWAHISDAEFISAAEQLGAVHVHAARTLIQKDFEEN